MTSFAEPEKMARSGTLGPADLEKKQSMILPQSASILALQKESKLNSKRSRRKEGRVRVKLPIIESYEKEFEYTADAPGRVVVRLERLMGTDRIRVTDPRYMSNLFKQLEADEQKLWLKRSKQRKMSERNRFRQLAIEGHMDPGPDMQDLYNHPVFRVNRILNRLSKLDSVINVLPTAPLPAITPVEPFDEYQRTGILFPFHPGHYRRTASSGYKADNEESDLDRMNSIQPSAKSSEVSTVAHETNEEFLRKYQRESGMITTSGAEMTRGDEWGGEDYEYADYENKDKYTSEVSEVDEGPPTRQGCNIDMMGPGLSPLRQVERFFGIRQEEKLEKTFTPHRSALVDQVFNEEETGGANEIYTSAKEVTDTYKREQLRTNEVVNKLHRIY